MSSPSVFLFRAFASAALASASLAQVQQVWSAHVGGADGLPESGTASAVDGSGATFIARMRDVDPSVAWSFDAVLTKIDSQGAVEWERVYDQPTGGAQSFTMLGLDGVGDVVVAGLADAVPFVARYDTNGNQVWVRVLSGTPGLRFEAMRVLPTGDVVLAGAVSGASLLDDAFVTWLRPDGTTAWSYVHAGSAGGSDSASDVVLDATGNVFVTGQAGTDGDIVQGMFALELDNGGTLVWSTEFLPPATGHHQAQRAAIDAQGRLYVADTVSVNEHELLGLVQFDANGAIAWSRQVPATERAHVVGIAIQQDGSVLVGAELLGVPLTSAGAFVGAWNASGTALWSAGYSAPGGDREHVTDFDLDPAGGAILTGWHTAAPNARVLFIAHVTDVGQQDWTQILGTGNTYETVAELEVAADDSLRVVSQWMPLFSGDSRVRVRRLERDVTAFCSGDGSATSCPCDNVSGPRSGCANSFGIGVALTGSGSASLAFDALTLRAGEFPQTTVTFFQGTARVAGGSGVVFGDGLRCAGGSVVRLGTLSVPAFSSIGFPSWGQSLSQMGHVTSPGLRTYQCWYRNVASFCTPEAFNTSNGLAVLWRP